ncbi:O-antigen ligase family protein [Chelativorans salis]|uniref:O-antigen ligase family protein n=1 Tax=Chelativorans salis TaxID=2978478 RepID=A0ABT2LTH6_9HYPH|nr:O-antigen ligase [Chelativorans sp. EGI FJ00035]MCT7377845.1 O-antigen ligase family protein [Chelativorans sp. EGI FJ00035]
MKIPVALFVNPERNFAYGSFAVAVSLFVFAYSTRFGQVPILVYYALWLPLPFIDPQRYLRGNAHLPWIVAFGVFALLSAFWSAAPSATARAGVQYLTHIACALIAARSVSPRTLTLGGLAGVALVLAYSLAFGGFHYDPIDGTYSFVGAFSSKNQLGFFASLGIYLAFAALLLLRERGLTVVMALFVGALSGYCLLASQSATSIITVTIALAASLAMNTLQLFAPIPRKLLFIAGTALALLGLFAALQLGAFDAVLSIFGKDATLTGRTYLWSEGMAAAREHPLLGIGYQAYWVHGFPDAERLWEEFYITARTGFHFHNTYIETLVEVGAIGLVLLVILLIGIIAGHTSKLLGNRHDPAAWLMFGLSVMLLLRSLSEVDVITPYVVGSFLLYYAAGTAFDLSRRTAQSPIPS